MAASAPLAGRRQADRRALTFAMSLSFVVGLAMLVIKVGAYLLTGSAAILSDAAESVVHVAAVSFAFYSLRLSYKPPDEGHPYGHAKIGFFSAWALVSRTSFDSVETCAIVRPPTSSMTCA